MTDLSKKSVLVLDNGLFVDVAEVLARSFGKVLYATAWRQPFPQSRDLMAGDGFESFERVKYEARYFDQVDMVCCPDVMLGDYQAFLRRLQIPVWGAGEGDRLELDRVWSKQVLEEAGLPVGRYEVVVGLDNLRKFLKENPEVYVKSQFRGDFETLHCDSFPEWEDWLDKMQNDLGPVGRKVEVFLCEWPIEAIVETGYDGWSINGNFPSLAMEAVEVKDKGMVGCFKPYEKLSKQVRYVNARLAPLLRKFDYRGFLSTEIRVTEDRTPYLIDPCCRCGSPSHELLLEGITNLPEVIWAGAHGELVEPKPAAKYGVIVVVQSQWAEDNWQTVRFPEEVRRWVKLKNHTRLLGRDTVIPQDYHLQQIGGVVGLGNTVAQAVARARDVADQVKGLDVNCKLDSLHSAIETIEAAREIGVEFASEHELAAAEEALQ